MVNERVFQWWITKNLKDKKSFESKEKKLRVNSPFFEMKKSTLTKFKNKSKGLVNFNFMLCEI